MELTNVKLIGSGDSGYALVDKSNNQEIEGIVRIRSRTFKNGRRVAWILLTDMEYDSKALPVVPLKLNSPIPQLKASTETPEEG